MLDSYNRNINYLRVSVTDRCNLRCVYCMPSCGIKALPHEAILRFEEIIEVVRFAVGQGVHKVRITGGEPLVRKDIVSLVALLARIEGIKDLAMTTNAVLLEKFAKPLADAGLQRVNISLDSIEPATYKQITRGGDIQAVFRGIEAAKAAGLEPIKVNCVVKNSSDEPHAQKVKDWAVNHGLLVRFIHEMDLARGQFSTVEGGEGGNCAQCNRMRLTANGDLKPCLFTDLSYNIRQMGIKEAYLAAVTNKPACGSINHHNAFSNIGG